MYNVPNRILAGWVPPGLVRSKASLTSSTSAVIASASTATFGPTYPVALFLNASDGTTCVTPPCALPCPLTFFPFFSSPALLHTRPHTPVQVRGLVGVVAVVGRP